MKRRLCELPSPTAQQSQGEPQCYHVGRFLRPTTKPTTSTKSPCKHWTPWRKYVELRIKPSMQDDLDSSSDALTAATKDFTDCWVCTRSHGREALQRQGSWQSAQQFMKQYSWPRSRRCSAQSKSSAKPRNYKRTWRSSGRETDVSRMNMPGHSATSTTASVPSERPCKQRPGATHSLTCGVPDRESNEVKCLARPPSSSSCSSDSKVGNGWALVPPTTKKSSSLRETPQMARQCRV